MPQLLVFDWDGTLIDSADRIVDCMQLAAKDVGMPKPSEESVRDIIGLGLPEALEVIYPGIGARQIELMRHRYSERFLADDQQSSPLFPGVEAGLEQLAEKGYLLAVATGKSRRGLDRAFRETGLGSYFADSRCADETSSKPHPQMLLELLERFQLPASDAVMIGDTEYDLAMAVNASMPSVGVSYGVHSVARLRKHQPLHVVDQFAELESVLDQLGHRKPLSGARS